MFLRPVQCRAAVACQRGRPERCSHSWSPRLGIHTLRICGKGEGQPITTVPASCGRRLRQRGLTFPLPSRPHLVKLRTSVLTGGRQSRKHRKCRKLTCAFSLELTR